MVGDLFVLCMRVPSNKPKALASGETAYLHRISDAPKQHYVRKPDKPRPDINWDKLVSSMASKTSSSDISHLSSALGVKPSSLLELRAFWHPLEKAFGFPMREGATGKLCGVRLRSNTGDKWCVTGSKNALFIPYCEVEPEMYIVEGGTNVAALRSINIFAVGRPSNSGGLNELIGLIKRCSIRSAVIVEDNDEWKSRPDGSKFNPGMDGGESLSGRLPIPHCCIMLPTKDARDYVNAGGTRDFLESMKNQVVWRNVTTPSSASTR